MIELVRSQLDPREQERWRAVLELRGHAPRTLFVVREDELEESAWCSVVATLGCISVATAIVTVRPSSRGRARARVSGSPAESRGRGAARDRRAAPCTVASRTPSPDAGREPFVAVLAGPDRAEHTGSIEIEHVVD